MSYSHPMSSMDRYSPTTEETISIGTMDDNLSETFFLKYLPSDAEPVSLAPLRRANSLDSLVSDKVNCYFQHLQPNPIGKLHGDPIQRTKTFLDRDWRKRTERRGSWVEKMGGLAIQVFKDTRSKLTKLITEVAVLFPYLKQMEILTSDDCDRIDQHQLRSLKTDALIDVIITRGIKGVVYFCESLKIHYNHLYVTLKQIFEINGIEIESLLGNGGRQAKVISEIFRSIEDIMGPKFAQEKLDAQQLLDSISAVKIDNVSSQDINELRGRYIELQNHYQPIQHIIDTLTTEIATKYNCLTSENEATLAAIDKLYTENGEMYEKMKSLHLKLEHQQDELDRRSTNRVGKENIALYQRIMDLDIPDEKLELMRLNQLLQKEKIQNEQLKDQIGSIRKEKDELFDMNQKLLKENIEYKNKAGPIKNYDDSTLKSNELTKGLEALSHTVKKKNKDINEALSIITPKRSEIFQVITKPAISIENPIKQHLAQSIEIGAFFSDSLDRSLVKSLLPGDRILRINNIKLSNMTNTNFPQIMMQQVESSLRLLIAPGPLSMGNLSYVEHNFTFTQDEISRCPSPCTFVDSGRLTPVPDYHRRISNQSYEALIRPDCFLPTLKQPQMNDNSAFSRGRAETRAYLNREFPSSAKNAFESNCMNTTVSSCPSTPQQERPHNIAIKTNKLERMKSLATDSGSESDTISRDSDSIPKPHEKAKRTSAQIPRSITNQFELDASPMFPKEFPGTMENFEAMPDIFGARTYTGITGMIIFPRSKTNVRPGESVEDSVTSFNKDQICTTVSNEAFLKHAKVSGGFGNPFFLSCSKELNQSRLKSGQKIYQINDISTEYLTYELFIHKCEQSPYLTLFVSLNPSPDFKPDGLGVRDHFYVIAHFTTNCVRVKGELFVSPSCVYLVTDTMCSKDDTAAQNRYWHVTRIDPRNCNNIEEGVIPSDLWLDHSINNSEESFEYSIESRGPHSSLKSSLSGLEVFEHDIGYYYDLEGVRNRKEDDFTVSPFSCYTLVTRQDHLPQPVILFDYHWEEYSEKLANQNGTKNPSQNTKFQLITPTIIENVDFAKNVELEAKHRACEIIYYKGTDGKARFVDVKSLMDCAENYYTPVLLCPIGQIYDAPVLVQLNPIVIRIKFKYKYKFDAPADQRFHFDDMLSVGLSEEKYVKKLIKLIDNNRVLYEWKAVVIES